MTRDEIFAEKFSELTVSEQVACYNLFAEYNHYAEIMPLDEYTVNELFGSMSPWDIAWKFRDVDLMADYFVDDTYFTTYRECDIYEDLILDYVYDIYRSDHFGNWIDEVELDERCEEYIRGVIKENYPNVSDDDIEEFIGDYYCNEDEDNENLKEFQAFLDEREKAEDEDDEEGDE